MNKATSAFLEEEYLPPGVIPNDPRNMHLDDVQKFLRHIYVRQAESGPELAFRFKTVLDSKRKQTLAAYPNHAGDISTDRRTRRKDKGKDRENVGDNQFRGLHRIGEEDDNPIDGPDHGNSGGDSQTHSQRRDSDTLSGDKLIRIDMGQMLQLRELGYEVAGPINGPDDGFPEYEVCQELLNHLADRPTLHDESEHEDDESEQGHIPVRLTDCIDPALITNASRTKEDSGQNSQPQMEQQSDHQTDQPLSVTASEPANADVSPNRCDPRLNVTSPQVITQVGTPKRRSKRRANLRSPQLARNVEETTRKRKKMTDDDRAALEAGQMVQSGSRRRRQPKKH